MARLKQYKRWMLHGIDLVRLTHEQTATRKERWIVASRSSSPLGTARSRCPTTCRNILRPGEQKPPRSQYVYFLAQGEKQGEKQGATALRKTRRKDR